MKKWMIYRTSDGVVVGTREADVETQPDTGFAQKEYTFTGSPLNGKVVNGTYVPWAGPSTAEIEALLLSRVDTVREVSQMQLLTPGGAKKMIYNSKQDELKDYSSLGSGVISTLNSAAIAARFPYVSKEIALSGETIQVAMARIKLATAANLVEVQRLEAITQVGKRLIKAATTGVAKQAAFDAINWNWGK